MAPSPVKSSRKGSSSSSSSAARSISDDLSGLTDIVREIEGERDEYLSELQNRARQVNDLCKTALAIRVVAQRITKGSCTDKDMTAMQPPKIHMRGKDGVAPALTYIKESMSMMRPILLDLFSEKMNAASDRRAISKTLQAARRIPRPDEEDILISSLTGGQMSALLKDIPGSSMDENDGVEEEVK